MQLRLDKGLVVAAVAVLSTLSWWLPIEPASLVVVKKEQLREQRHISDYYMKDFELTAVSAAGEPRHRMTATDLTHYADDDTALIQRPHLEMYRPGLEPWVVDAGQAQVSARGETVLLQNQVHMERVSIDERRKLVVQTEKLKITPATEYAITDQPVIIMNHLGVTQSVGMEADLKQDRLQLLAQVRGDYEKD